MPRAPIRLTLSSSLLLLRQQHADSCFSWEKSSLHGQTREEKVTLVGEGDVAHVVL